MKISLFGSSFTVLSFALIKNAFQSINSFDLSTISAKHSEVALKAVVTSSYSFDDRNA